MDVGKKLAERNSEEEFAYDFHSFSDSGAGVIHVRAREVVRAIQTLRKTLIADHAEYFEWNVLNGTYEVTTQNLFKHNIQGDGQIDIGQALARPLNELTAENRESDKMRYFVYLNPQFWLEGNPRIYHTLQAYCSLLPSTDYRVVLLTPDIPLPNHLSDYIVTVDFKTPGISELSESYESILNSVDDDVVSLDADERQRICMSGLGLSKEHFELYLSHSIVDAARLHDREENDAPIDCDEVIRGLSVGKTEIVRKNDLLELFQPEDMANVGGMANLKGWVNRRKGCYSDEAKEYGIEPPSGIVLVGLPGVGKSLSAKAIARELGVPLIRLDFGRVFNSLVGASEERMRTALSMVESMSPVVLMVDEIDKALGGIGSGGDAGTSSRVLGTFLTWLQENDAPVFTVVTANNIEGLPPELMRRGRFDAIFSTALPNDAEREQVFKIHLRKRGWDDDCLGDKGMADVVTKSNGYVPAEIESAIKDGLIDAFSNGEEFSAKHVLHALDTMVPLSKSHAEQVLKTMTWAKNNAIPAGGDFEKPKLKGIDGGNTKGRVRSTRRRKATDEDKVH